ncbi:MAG TPA: tyrosinase family protein [Solirubrobacterales bacterium]|nr:tyrosinase family protein [Solirubrobacterales bacterium]
MAPAVPRRRPGGQAAMSSASPSATRAPRPLRHRRSVRRLTTGQVADLRDAVAAAQEIDDDRGYQRWGGIHGLPLPIFCTHHTELFLPWHRAYLYLFEKALQERVPGVTLPWWDWTANHAEGVPAAYSRRRVSGRRNPLFDSPIQPGGRENRRQARTVRSEGGPGELPSPDRVEAILSNRDFLTFQTQLESVHDGVHVWVGGTMESIATAAYDPIFWAHHCMIDRLWYLWQLRHPGVGIPARLLDRALAPFPLTVRQTLDVSGLGYDYAASTAAAEGPGHG